MGGAERLSTRGRRDPQRWLALEAVRSELGARSVRSGAFALVARAGHALLQLGSFLVLARLLTPDDFGVIGMVLPFAILANSVTNVGLQTTVIHRETLDHGDASAVFWYAAGANLLALAAMAALGPLLAWLYGEPRVVAVTAVWAGIIYCAALGAVHEALLKRQMRFVLVLSLQLASLAAGTALGIVLALRGAEHWALVAQIAVLELGRSGSMWIACGWRPTRASRSAWRSSPTVAAMRGYWRGLGLFRLASWFGDHPDRMLVGHLGGAGVLGLYESARRWAWYPFIELFLSLSDVAVATFSRVQREAERYRAQVRHGITGILTLTMPATALLFVEAGPIVSVLLGSTWLGAVPFVRLMCVAAFFGAFSRITQWLYLSRGETGRQLRWAAVATSTMAVTVLVGANWGALGVAWGFMIATAGLSLPAFAYCVHGSPVRLGDAVAAAARPVACSVTAAVATHFGGAHLPSSTALLDLVARVTLFGAAYLAAWLVVPGGQRTIRDVARALRPSPRARPANNRSGAPNGVAATGRAAV